MRCFLLPDFQHFAAWPSIMYSGTSIMGPVSLKLHYRPLRIGWCIEADSLDHFSSAVALSHVFGEGVLIQSSPALTGSSRTP